MDFTEALKHIDDFTFSKDISDYLDSEIDKYSNGGYVRLSDLVSMIDENLYRSIRPETVVKKEEAQKALRSIMLEHPEGFGDYMQNLEERLEVQADPSQDYSSMLEHYARQNRQKSNDAVPLSRLVSLFYDDPNPNTVKNKVYNVKPHLLEDLEDKLICKTSRVSVPMENVEEVVGEISAHFHETAWDNVMANLSREVSSIDALTYKPDKTRNKSSIDTFDRQENTDEKWNEEEQFNVGAFDGQAYNENHFSDELNAYCQDNLQRGMIPFSSLLALFYPKNARQAVFARTNRIKEELKEGKLTYLQDKSEIITTGRNEKLMVHPDYAPDVVRYFMTDNERLDHFRKNISYANRSANSSGMSDASLESCIRKKFSSFETHEQDYMLENLNGEYSPLKLLHASVDAYLEMPASERSHYSRKEAVSYVSDKLGIDPEDANEIIPGEFLFRVVATRDLVDKKKLEDFLAETNYSEKPEVTGIPGNPVSPASSYESADSSAGMAIAPDKDLPESSEDKTLSSDKSFSGEDTILVKDPETRSIYDESPDSSDSVKDPGIDTTYDKPATLPESFGKSTGSFDKSVESFEGLDDTAPVKDSEIADTVHGPETIDITYDKGSSDSVQGPEIISREKLYATNAKKFLKQVNPYLSPALIDDILRRADNTVEKQRKFFTTSALIDSFLQMEDCQFEELRIKEQYSLAPNEVVGYVDHSRFVDSLPKEELEQFGSLNSFIIKHRLTGPYTRNGNVCRASYDLLKDHLKVSIKSIPEYQPPTWMAGETEYTDFKGAVDMMGIRMSEFTKYADRFTLEDFGVTGVPLHEVIDIKNRELSNGIK
ncbi:MAG: hypothetical protein R6V53_06045 [Candidatus Woesearchaeota archaeon]